VISFVSYLIILLRTIQILLNTLEVHKLALGFSPLKTVSFLNVLLGVLHSTFIPHFHYSFTCSFSLKIKGKTALIASDFHLNASYSKPGRRARAELWHSHTVTSSTAVSPRPFGFACFLVFLV